MTGGTGFIGYHTLPFLVERGFEVHATTTREDPPNVPDIRWHHVDCLHSEQTQNLFQDIRPTHLRRLAGGGGNVPAQSMGFGISVNVDINNRQVRDDLTGSEVRDIVTFANDYVPEELIKFLNNEY